MAVDPELVALMIQEVTWKPRTALDGYGEATFGTATTVRCRVEAETKMVLRPDGQEAVSGAQVYTDAVYGIGIEDEITLPDGTAGTIITVATHWDETGPSHEVVYL